MKCTYPDHVGNRMLPKSAFTASKRTRWCKACMRAHSKKQYHKNKDRILATNRRGARKWTCLCPRCETSHTQKIIWIGRGVPRIMCTQCRNTDEYRDSNVEESMAYG